MHCHHGPGERDRYLRLFRLSFLMGLAELGVGFLTGSLALIADGLHAFSDTLESLWNAYVSERARFITDSSTLRRAGFLVSASLIGTSTGFMAIHAWERLMSLDPAPLTPWTVLVGFVALAVNAAMWRIHESAPDHDRNVTHLAQRLHILSDIGATVAALVGVGLSSLGSVPVADAWAALIVALVIWVRLSFAGYKLFIHKEPVHQHWIHYH